MHILIIPAWYKDKSHPLRGVFFEEQARALQKRGHKVGVVVPLFVGYSEAKKSFFKSYDDKGIYTITQQVKALTKRSSKINNNYFLNRVYHKAFKNYIKHNGKPDVVHSHVYKYSGLLGAFIRKRMGIPHVFTEHFSVWVNPESNVPPSDVRVLNSVLNGTDRAFAVSRFLQKALLQRTEDKYQIAILPNMINDLFLQDTEVKAKHSRFRFINIGGFSKVKNQMMLLKAFSVFVTSYKVDVELYIVGDGALRHTLEKAIHDLELTDVVVLAGNLDRESIKQEIQKSHVGVISSIVETFSIAGIEFMSQGLPVISTNCGGPNDYIDDFNGVVVKDEQEMVEAFYNLFTQYKTYDQEKIAHYIQTHFSEPVFVKKLEKIYLEVLK